MAMIPVFTNKITIIQKGIQITVAHIIPANDIKIPPFKAKGGLSNTTKHYLSIIIFINKYSWEGDNKTLKSFRERAFYL
jgi:hypothetical protein